MRNGDKLRQMTDEEMANIISLPCPPDGGQVLGKMITGCVKTDCAWCWMCWMAEEDEE